MLDAQTNRYFSAGRDPTELPGGAEGRLVKHQRRLWKSVEEVSEKRTNRTRQNLVHPDIFLTLSLCLGSGPNDHVFVYFTDHGAPGILAFPNDDVSIFYFLLVFMHQTHTQARTIKPDMV